MAPVAGLVGSVASLVSVVAGLSHVVAGLPDVVAGLPDVVPGLSFVVAGLSHVVAGLPDVVTGLVGTVGGLLGIAVIVAVNATVAAVATRFFRLRLATRWGPVVYVAVLLPPVLVALTLVLSGVLRLGADLGDPSTALLVAVVLPIALGVSVDLFWMPPPDEVELPDPAE